MQDNQKMTIPEMVEGLRAGTLPRREFIKVLTAMGISAAGVGAIAAAAASRAFTAHPVPTPHTEEETHNIHLHEQHITNQMQGNTGMIQNDYANHAIVEDSMHETAFVGKQAIMQRKSLTAIPNLQLNVTNRIARGSQVTVEWVARGTHSTDLPGLVATGRDFEFRGVTVVVRENGKIVREAIYYDVAEVRRVLGA